MSFSASSNRILVKDSSNVVKLDTNERLLQIVSASNLSDTIPNIPSNSGYFSNTRLIQSLPYPSSFFRTPSPALFLGGFYNPGFNVMVLAAISYTYYYASAGNIYANTTGFHQSSLVGSLAGGNYQSFFWAGNYDL